MRLEGNCDELSVEVGLIIAVHVVVVVVVEN